MTSKISTFNNQADFDQLGQRIRQAAGVPFALVQTGLLAAFEHIKKNGNVNALKPIMSAIEDTFRNRGMVNRVRAYTVQFTWLEYNKADLRGQKLKDTPFDAVWTKNKSKKMNIDGAREVKWYDVELEPKRKATKAVAKVTVAHFIKRLQNMLNDHQLVDDDGNAVTVAKLRAELKSQMEGLKAPETKTPSTVTRLPAGNARGHKAIKPAPVKAPATVEAKAA